MSTYAYSKLIDRTWDSETLSLIASIYRHIGMHEQYLKLRPFIFEKYEESVKIQNIDSSNAIDGIHTSNIRLRRLIAETTTPKNLGEQKIARYRDIYNEISMNYRTIPLTTENIIRLQKKLCGAEKEAYSIKSSDSFEYILTQSASFRVAEELDKMCKGYNRVIGKHEVEPLVVIPIFIRDFLCIHPFNDGNARISRLLTMLLLYQNGYHIGKYVSLEAKIKATKDLYFEAFSTTSNDDIPFIKYFLKLMLSAYKEFEERTLLLEDSSKAIDFIRDAVTRLPKRFKRNDLREICPTYSITTIAKGLSALINEGTIETEGQKRRTIYIKKQE